MARGPKRAPWGCVRMGIKIGVERKRKRRGKEGDRCHVVSTYRE